MLKLQLGLLCSLCFLVATAQQNLSGSIYTGLLVPQTDFDERNYTGAKPNLAVGAGLGFNVEESIRVRGDLLFGQLSGNNDQVFHETVIIEPSLGLEVNLLGLFTDFDGIKLKAMGGTGISFYYARLYSMEGKRLLVQSPVRTEKGMSPNAFVSFGGQLGVMLTPKLELNLGYNQRHLFNTPYLDAVEAGESTDHYGLASVGMSFYLKSDRTPNTVEVKEEVHARAVRRSDSLSLMQRRYEEKSEALAEQEMLAQEQKLKIHSLVAERDSLKAYKAEVDSVRMTTPDNGTTATADDLSEEKYRVIIASLPSEKAANAWINRLESLDKTDIRVIYIENLDTYRVIYKSYDSYSAARKEQQRIKSNIPDAWIIKL